MQQKDLDIAQTLKAKISSLVPVLDFRIFGSRARGDADPFSDMDVFIEVDLINKNLKEAIHDLTWEVGFENFMVICPLIFTRDEIENSPLRSSPIVRNIFNEGVRV